MVTSVCSEKKICQVRIQDSARDYKKSKWHHSYQQIYRISSGEVKGTLGTRSENLPVKHMRRVWWTHLHTPGQYELIMQQSLQCLIWSCNVTWTHLVSSSLSTSPCDVLHVPFLVDCETMCHREILLILRRCQSRKEVRDVSFDALGKCGGTRLPLIFIACSSRGTYLFVTIPQSPKTA